MQCDLKAEKKIATFENGKKGLLEKIRELGRQHNISDILPLATKDICVAHWVRLKCKYGCKNYARSWCCPPETPTPEETIALLGEYQQALLLWGKTKNSQFHTNSSKKRRIQVHIWKGTLALERWLFLAGYYKAFALVSEKCALCKECTYPEGCLFPMERRPSVESCSIDIFQTLRNIGQSFRIAIDVEEEYHCYSIILLE